MTESTYNPSWQYIPFNERSAAYSKSIKMHNHLWVKPTYEVGEVWEFYGSFRDEEHEIVALFKDSEQVMTKTPDGKRHLFDLCKHGYAKSGTPELRIRIK